MARVTRIIARRQHRLLQIRRLVRGLPLQLVMWLQVMVVKATSESWHMLRLVLKLSSAPQSYVAFHCRAASLAV